MKSIHFINLWFSMMIVIRSLISYILGIFIVLFLFIPCMIMVALLPARYRYDNAVLFWLLDKLYRSIIWATFLPLQIAGKKHIPKTPAIFVANHQSALDIPLMGILLHGHPHIWYVLDYYLKFPVFSFFIRRMCVPVTRDNGMRAAQSLVQGIRLVKGKNRHTIIFPEGTRVVDPQDYKFLGGFGIIAKKTGYPVIPVYLHNVGKVYPPDSLLIHYHPLRIVVGEPFYYGEHDTDQIFNERVRNWFVKQLS